MCRAMPARDCRKVGMTDAKANKQVVKPGGHQYIGGRKL